MSDSMSNLVNRARRCPFACFLKVSVVVSFVYALHVAVFHQSDMSSHSFALLVDSVGLLAMLALAMHWVCSYRHPEEKD